MQTEENTMFRFTGYPGHCHRQDSPMNAFNKPNDHRRSNKPIMEKRRRARINHCLAELKTLILEAMKKDPARHSKLEKADILEMTVKHLQAVQRQQMAIAVATDPTVMTKFRSGFNDCAAEVVRYVSRMDGVDPGVSQRLMGHMRNCLTSLNHLSSPFNFMSVPQLHPAWFYTAASPASTSGPFAFEPRPPRADSSPDRKGGRSAFESLLKENDDRKEDDDPVDVTFGGGAHAKSGSNKRVTGQTIETNRETCKPSTSSRCAPPAGEKMWRPWSKEH